MEYDLLVLLIMYVKTYGLLLQPLSLDSDSGWGRFFEDNTTLLQIDHDTR